MQTCIWPDAQILLRHKWRKLATASLFIVWTGKVASVIGMSFFICLSGFRLKFSRIALLRKRLQLDSKSDLTTNGLILEFFVGVRIFSLTPYLHVLNFAWIARMCCSFDDIKFFGWLVWGLFSSVLFLCPYFLVTRFCNLASWALAMHLYFPFFVRLSSSVSFAASTDELTINISENHIVPRISFFQLAVCWCSTPFTASCVLRNINGHFYCTCSFLAPLVAELFFWRAETWQNLTFSRCIHAFDLLLKFCSYLNEGIWLQLLFCFIIMMNLVSSVVGMSFFHLCFRFWVEVFSNCTFTETFASGLQNWFDHKWIDFGGFFLNMVIFVDLLSAWTEVCMNSSNLFPFWLHQVFSITSLKDTLVCCSNVFVLFSQKII